MCVCVCVCDWCVSVVQSMVTSVIKFFLGLFLVFLVCFSFAGPLVHCV